MNFGSKKAILLLFEENLHRKSKAINSETLITKVVQ